MSLNTVSRLQCCCGSTCFCTRQTRTRVVAVRFSPWTHRIVQDVHAKHIGAINSPGISCTRTYVYFAIHSFACLAPLSNQPLKMPCMAALVCVVPPTSCSFYPAGIIYSRSRVNRRDISRYTLCVLLDDSNSDTCCSSPVLLYNLGDPLHHCPHPLGLPAHF